MPNLFIDSANILVKSGKGGAGKVSFRREKYFPKGGPDGGDGGSGGDIIFRVNHRMRSLMDITQKKYYFAQNGEDGGGRGKSGKSGQDLVIEVPPGTSINSNSKLLHDMEDIGEIVLLKGGLGGRGNAFFKSSTNRSPQFAQPGISGKELQITLELKLLADVGVIGSPNAGKSQFLARVSNAKPKIANYPFTTLRPNLGVVKRFSDRPSFTISDIPGLIEGASKGVGLGMNFLKHIERTKILVHILDGSLPLVQIEKNFHIINNELKFYDQKKSLNLSKKKQIVVINKTDLVDKSHFQKLNFYASRLFYISSITRDGIDILLHHILDSLNENLKEESMNSHVENL